MTCHSKDWLAERLEEKEEEILRLQEIIFEKDCEIERLQIELEQSNDWDVQLVDGKLKYIKGGNGNEN